MLNYLFCGNIILWFGSEFVSEFEWVAMKEQWSQFAMRNDKSNIRWGQTTNFPAIVI